MHRQPRFYGPLLGILLANLFTKSVFAKLSPLGHVRFSYEPLAPLLGQNYPQTLINNYAPVQTTSKPTEIYEIHDINHPPYPIQETNQSDYIENHDIPTNIEPPQDTYGPPYSAYDLIPAESNVYRRYAPSRVRISNNNRNKKRGTPIKYNRRRRPEYYYDSYEDFTTQRYKLKRKYRPQNRPLDLYEYDDDAEYNDDDYDSYEFTTKPYKRRRTTQKRRKNNKKQNINELDSDEDVEISNRQQTSTTESTTTGTTPTTLITNGTQVPTTANTTNNTYGKLKEVFIVFLYDK